MTFTDPEIGAVGLTEAQARSRNVVVRTAVSQIPSSSRGWIHGPDNDGFIKLIADSDAGVLVGVTSAGPVGGEVLGALAVAVHAQVPVAMLSQMIYAYPTFHRAIEDAIARPCLRPAERGPFSAAGLGAAIYQPSSSSAERGIAPLIDHAHPGEPTAGSSPPVHYPAYAEPAAVGDSRRGRRSRGKTVRRVSANNSTAWHPADARAVMPSTTSARYGVTLISASTRR